VGEHGDAPRYSFGDTELAARRLELVATVFEAASRDFLTRFVSRPVAVALDLGCGPGLTTRLLAGVARPERTIGLDSSAAFVERAQRDAPTGVSFRRHDVTQLPLPGAPADLIYCRLLLAHLRDPVAVVAAWVTQLSVGGCLAVDEVEWIDTTHPVLAAYERMVVGLVASRGGPMYAGPVVATMSDSPTWRVRSSELRVVPVDTAAAARMYWMNLMTWRADPYVTENHPPAEVDRLANGLVRLAASPCDEAITWGLRQVVFERRLSPDAAAV
jgi:SAM-dependent methyltransferase